MDRIILRLLIPLVLVLAAVAPPVNAAAARDGHVTAAPGADALAEQFFALVRAGKSVDAVEYAFANTSVMNGRNVEKQNLAGQINNATALYGPIGAVELVDETKLGTMFVKRHYIAQHREMLTRWEMILARLDRGWAVTFIKFDDTVQNWD